MHARTHARPPARPPARQILSSPDNPPVAQTIAAGVIPVFVEGLKDMNNPAMRYEAAWALTNVASSEHTGVVVEHC